MPVPADIPRHRFTSKDVSEMVKAGVLHERSRVELINGELIVPPSEGPVHANLAAVLARHLRRAAYPDDRFIIRLGNPLVLNDMTEPQPDVVVVLGNDETFLTRHPTGQETVLVIEIAHSSLKLDRAMAEDYAVSGVPHYWIVDVAGKVVEWYAQPDTATGIYAHRGKATTVTLPGTSMQLSLEQLPL